MLNIWSLTTSGPDLKSHVQSLWLVTHLVTKLVTQHLQWAIGLKCNGLVIQSSQSSQSSRPRIPRALDMATATSAWNFYGSRPWWPRCETQGAGPWRAAANSCCVLRMPRKVGIRYGKSSGDDSRKNLAKSAKSAKWSKWLPMELWDETGFVYSFEIEDEFLLFCDSLHDRREELGDKSRGDCAYGEALSGGLVSVLIRREALPEPEREVYNRFLSKIQK